jgi:IS30 family transposase
VAQCKAELMARGRRPRSSPPTRICASTCNSGSAVRFAGPTERWRALRRRRGTGGTSLGARIARWATAWSPEQIANRLAVDFPDDQSMRISHEAIYQSLYVQGRGALKRELVACLRTGRALRVPRARADGRGKGLSPTRS